jgi:pyruvate/2-oxoglutarate/acetoin dehydrogenase E1 component
MIYTSNESLKTYSEAIRDANEYLLKVNKSVFLIGLGMQYGAGGTTSGLKNQFPSRILDGPNSEAALTGFSLGAAISGLKPILHHDRAEFCLVSADQIITQASKWNYMFGGKNNASITIRVTIGRQWGSGPQHTQSFYSLFGNTTGLKVVIASTPFMAKGLLIAACNDPNPVIVIEPRWIFSLKQHIPIDPYEVSLSKMNIVKEGKDVTVVVYGDGLYSVLQVQEMLGDKLDLEIIDVVSINPIDTETLFKSVKKTVRLITIDTTNKSFNIGSEIISITALNKEIKLIDHPVKISCPDVPCPTSTSFTEFYYPNRVTICNEILKLFDMPIRDEVLSFEELNLPPKVVIPSCYIGE